jgi:hypothetical protein
MAERPLTKEIAVFVKFHLADKHAFAPFTGQDFSAWAAFLYACQLYGRSDYGGQRGAIDAMRALVHAAQQKDDVLAVFKKAIPGVLDWSHEEEIWPKIAPMGKGNSRLTAMPYLNAVGYIAWPCPSGPRICSHVRSKPSKKHPGFFVCSDPTCRAEWRLEEECA